MRWTDVCFGLHGMLTNSGDGPELPTACCCFSLVVWGRMWGGDSVGCQ